MKIDDLDQIDLRILARLQSDSQISNQDLAEEIGLSAPACLRRVRLMRESGFIQGEICVLDPRKLGMSFWAIILIECERKRVDLMEALKRTMVELPEVMQCYAVTGPADFSLLVATHDMEHLDQFVEDHLRCADNIRRFETMIVMSRVKTTFQLPLERAGA